MKKIAAELNSVLTDVGNIVNYVKSNALSSRAFSSLWQQDADQAAAARAGAVVATGPYRERWECGMNS